MHVLTNICEPPEEGNFCVESRNTLKPATVEDYNGNLGYVDKNGIQLLYQSLYLEMDEETVLSSPIPQNLKQPNSPETP